MNFHRGKIARFSPGLPAKYSYNFHRKLFILRNVTNKKKFADKFINWFNFKLHVHSYNYPAINNIIKSKIYHSHLLLLISKTTLSTNELTLINARFPVIVLVKETRFWKLALFLLSSKCLRPTLFRPLHGASQVPKRCYFFNLLNPVVTIRTTRFLSLSLTGSTVLFVGPWPPFTVS
jgi:hypothetical protein